MLLKNKIKKSRKIALGGVISALSLLFMLLTAIFPFAEYALPALSGITLAVLVIEINKKTAYLAYAAVGVLSLLIAPVKEAAVLFILLLGYYPILKSSIEHIKSRVLEWIVKMSIFNGAILTVYLSMTYIFNMTEALAEVGVALKYGAFIFIVIANITFVVYDFALTKLIALYFQLIRPKLKSIIK